MKKDRRFRFPAGWISAARFLSCRVRRQRTWKRSRVLQQGAVLLAGIFLFPAWIPAQSPVHPAELEILQFINQERSRRNLPGLEFDQQASRICRAHSEEMNRGDFFSLSSPGKGSLKERLEWNGVFGLYVSAFAMRERSRQNIFDQLTKRGLPEIESCTHVGIGLHSAAHAKYGPRVLWVTLAFLNYGVKVEPLPQNVAPGYPLRVQGVCLAGYSRPRLFITLPEGKVRQVHNSLASLTHFLFHWTFDQGPGKYALEIMVDEARLGPRVAALIPVQVGDAPSRLPAPAPDPARDEFKTLQEATDFLFLSVNRARAEYGLKALQPDPILQATALSHSRDMARLDYCAHFNPKGESALHRFKNHGGRGGVAENISCTYSISAAHQGLMESPGHRANILNEDFTHMGIGVVRQGGQVYVTQLFQRKGTGEESEQVRQTIYQWLNRGRAEKGLPALALDPILVQTAENHSLRMVNGKSLQGEASVREFQNQFSRRGGKFKTLVVYRLAADSLRRVMEQLEKEKTHLFGAQFTQAGIGVQSGYGGTGQDEWTLWVTLALISRE